MTPVQQRVPGAKLPRRAAAPTACRPAGLHVVAGVRNSDAKFTGRKVMAVTFHGKVAIVTGAGSGLGRCHALGLAARGAKVVVNDLGLNGEPSAKALEVVEEIRSAGGEAIADPADVTDFHEVSAMAARAEAEWGRIDILVNNAGVLRDKTFAKMEMADFEFVLRVHLIGSVHCAKAVWAGMRERNYGRIVLTSSSSGIYGNFGQSNYGAAKAGLIGLMNVLGLEGARNDIRVNVLAPTARTAMTEGLLPPTAAALMAPETVTPAVLFLSSEEAPSRVILGAGAGTFAVTHITETAGVYLDDAERTPETILARWAEISDPATATPLSDAFGQTRKFVAAAAKAKGMAAGW
jgi:NAD(P)-dependent dehydrogenase (short-subunit alcohol dehydrogenase family)